MRNEKPKQTHGVLYLTAPYLAFRAALAHPAAHLLQPEGDEQDRPDDADRGRADIAEVVEEKQAEKTAVDEPSDPTGDVQIVSAKSVFAGKDRLTFVHECQGEVKVSEVVSGGKFGMGTTKFCVGKNFLSMKDAGAAEIALMSETVSTSTEDASILTGIEFVPSSDVMETGRLNGTILVSYAVMPCSISKDGCGVGNPTNFVTYAVDVATKEVRPIANYPGGGTPIWNDAGTKAIFPVVQVGGAGCEDRPISGYDLTTDASKPLTTEVACEFTSKPERNTARLDGNPLPSWGPVYWTSDSTFMTTILGIDGKWKQIDGTF